MIDIVKLVINLCWFFICLATTNFMTFLPGSHFKLITKTNILSYLSQIFPFVFLVALSSTESMNLLLNHYFLCTFCHWGYPRMLHTERHKYLILLTGENPTNIENDAHGFKKCVATNLFMSWNDSSNTVLYSFRIKFGCRENL